MRKTIIVLGAATLMAAGCETQQLGRVGEQPRQNITYAATAEYPGDAQTSDRVRAVAIDQPRFDRLEIYNLSDQSIPPSTVWVNGAFVYRANAIPPRELITVDYSQLLEAGPSVKDLRQLDQSVSRVELQTQDGLYAVQGPARR